MRTFFGVLVGIAITVAAAAIHDNNLSPPDPANPGLTDQQIVNWPVFNAVVRQMTDTIGNIWQNLTRKA
jgi:hypothetical protein